MKPQAWTEADADALAEFIYNTPTGQRFLAILKDRIFVKSDMRVERIGLTGEAAATVAAVELGTFKGGQDMLQHISALADFRQVVEEKDSVAPDGVDEITLSKLLMPDRV